MTAIADSNATNLDQLGSVGELTLVQRAAVRAMLKAHGALDLAPYFYGVPRTESERSGLRQRRAAAQAELAGSGAAGAPVVDPAYSTHPPEDIGTWRAQVAAWGRANGFPDAYSRRAQEAELVAAYRAAHPQEAS